MFKALGLIAAPYCILNSLRAGILYSTSCIKTRLTVSSLIYLIPALELKSGVAVNTRALNTPHILHTEVKIFEK